MKIDQVASYILALSALAVAVTVVHREFSPSSDPYAGARASLRKASHRLAAQAIIVIVMGIAALSRPQQAAAGGLCNVYCGEDCSANWTFGCYATGDNTCNGDVNLILCDDGGECAPYGLKTIYCSN